MKELLDDDFYTEIKKYLDCSIDYCIVKSNEETSHKNIVIFALKCWSKKDEMKYNYDEEKMQSSLIDNNTFFDVPDNYLKIKDNNIDNPKPYWYCFLFSPFGIPSRKIGLNHQIINQKYTREDFNNINNLLFPKGRELLEIFKWNDNWSNYFDDGLEWWGTCMYSIYDKKMNRFVVIAASQTD